MIKYCPHCGNQLPEDIIRQANSMKSCTVNDIKKYKSVIFCEHANECYAGPCRCPPDCACREFMCK